MQTLRGCGQRRRGLSEVACDVETLLLGVRLQKGVCPGQSWHTCHAGRQGPGWDFVLWFKLGKWLSSEVGPRRLSCGGRGRSTRLDPGQDKSMVALL